MGSESHRRVVVVVLAVDMGRLPVVRSNLGQLVGIAEEDSSPVVVGIPAVVGNPVVGMAAEEDIVLEEMGNRLVVGRLEEVRLSVMDEVILALCFLSPGGNNEDDLGKCINIVANLHRWRNP